MNKILLFSAALVLSLSLVSCNGAGAPAEATAESSPYDALGEMSLEEVVAVDNDECRITVTGIEQCEVDGSDAMAHEIFLHLENKNAESELVFYVDSATVNGLEWKSFFSEFVSAGEEAYTSIYFGTNDFDTAVGPFTDVELVLCAYDNGENGGNVVGEGTVRLYPYGEDGAELYKNELSSVSVSKADTAAE